MDRDSVIVALRRHASELRAAGIERLSLFGSVARAEATDSSDVDLLAAFDPSRRLSLLDIVDIELRLAEILGHRVDLIEEGTLKPRVKSNVDREIVRAF